MAYNNNYAQMFNAYRLRQQWQQPQQLQLPQPPQAQAYGFNAINVPGVRSSQSQSPYYGGMSSNNRFNPMNPQQPQQTYDFGAMRIPDISPEYRWRSPAWRLSQSIMQQQMQKWQEWAQQQEQKWKPWQNVLNTYRPLDGSNFPLGNILPQQPPQMPSPPQYPSQPSPPQQSYQQQYINKWEEIQKKLQQREPSESYNPYGGDRVWDYVRKAWMPKGTQPAYYHPPSHPPSERLVWDERQKAWLPPDKATGAMPTITDFSSGGVKPPAPPSSGVPSIPPHEGFRREPPAPPPSGTVGIPPNEGFRRDINESSAGSEGQITIPRRTPPPGEPGSTVPYTQRPTPLPPPLPPSEPAASPQQPPAGSPQAERGRMDDLFWSAYASVTSGGPGLSLADELRRLGLPPDYRPSEMRYRSGPDYLREEDYIAREVARLKQMQAEGDNFRMARGLPPLTPEQKEAEINDFVTRMRASLPRMAGETQGTIHQLAPSSDFVQHTQINANVAPPQPAPQSPSQAILERDKAKYPTMTITPDGKIKPWSALGMTYTPEEWEKVKYGIENTFVHATGGASQPAAAEQRQALTPVQQQESSAELVEPSLPSIESPDYDFKPIPTPFPTPLPPVQWMYPHTMPSTGPVQPSPYPPPTPLRPVPWETPSYTTEQGQILTQMQPQEPNIELAKLPPPDIESLDYDFKPISTPFPVTLPSSNEIPSEPPQLIDPSKISDFYFPDISDIYRLGPWSVRPDEFLDIYLPGDLTNNPVPVFSGGPPLTTMPPNPLPNPPMPTPQHPGFPPPTIPPSPIPPGFFPPTTPPSPIPSWGGGTIRPTTGITELLPDGTGWIKPIAPPSSVTQFNFTPDDYFKSLTGLLGSKELQEFTNKLKEMYGKDKNVEFAHHTIPLPEPAAGLLNLSANEARGMFSEPLKLSPPFTAPMTTDEKAAIEAFRRITEQPTTPEMRGAFGTVQEAIDRARGTPTESDLLRRTIAGEFLRPESSPYLMPLFRTIDDSVKPLVTNIKDRWDQTIAEARADAAARGMLDSSVWAEQQRRLLQQRDNEIQAALADASQRKLGLLESIYQRERALQSAAEEQPFRRALDLAQAMSAMGVNLGELSRVSPDTAMRAATSLFSFGGLPRQLEQHEIDARNQELLRQWSDRYKRTELALPFAEEAAGRTVSVAYQPPRYDLQTIMQIIGSGLPFMAGLGDNITPMMGINRNPYLPPISVGPLGLPPAPLFGVRA